MGSKQRYRFADDLVMASSMTEKERTFTLVAQPTCGKRHSEMTVVDPIQLQYQRLSSILASIECANAFLTQVVMLSQRFHFDLTEQQHKASLAVLRRLLKSLQDIKVEEFSQPCFKPLGRKLRNSRCVWLRKEKATPGTLYGCEKRCDQQMKLLNVALNRLKDIRRAKEMAQCSMSEVVHLGDFPEIETLLSQRSRPRFQRIIDTIGAQYL